MQETEKIWMNGELVDWADARVHVGVHGLHYGSGVARSPSRSKIGRNVVETMGAVSERGV